MHSPSESAALVALLRAGTHPWQAYADLLEEAGSAGALIASQAGGVIRAAAGADQPQPSLFNPDSGDPAADLAAAEADLAGWREQGLQLVTAIDPGYPENLLAVHDRPPFLFIGGRLTPGDSQAIAVIGARSASAAGAESAAAVAEHLVRSGYTVISGLAAGIDTVAHETALAHGGRTIAVLGTGLARCYPPSNRGLQRRIASEGAVVSQFWPDTPPSRTTFPARNAVMSGLALGSVIVEASERSGARIQARLALAHGRPVFLLERVIEQEWGRELAARPGVHVVKDPHEITETVERLSSADALVE